LEREEGEQLLHMQRQASRLRTRSKLEPAEQTETRRSIPVRVSEAGPKPQRHVLLRGQGTTSFCR
jgi:hypothetical protein